MTRESHLPLWKIARGLGWDIVSTRRRFCRAKVATRLPGTRDWLVSRNWLTVNLSSVLARIDELDDAGLLRSNRGCKRRSKSGRFEGIGTVSRTIENH